MKKPQKRIKTIPGYYSLHEYIFIVNVFFFFLAVEKIDKNLSAERKFTKSTRDRARPGPLQ